MSLIGIVKLFGNWLAKNPNTVLRIGEFGAHVMSSRPSSEPESRLSQEKRLSKLENDLKQQAQNLELVRLDLVELGRVANKTRNTLRWIWAAFGLSLLVGLAALILTQF